MSRYSNQRMKMSMMKMDVRSKHHQRNQHNLTRHRMKVQGHMMQMIQSMNRMMRRLGMNLPVRMKMVGMNPEHHHHKQKRWKMLDKRWQVIGMIQLQVYMMIPVMKNSPMVHIQMQSMKNQNLGWMNMIVIHHRQMMQLLVLVDELGQVRMNPLEMKQLLVVILALV